MLSFKTNVKDKKKTAAEGPTHPHYNATAITYKCDNASICILFIDSRISKAHAIAMPTVTKRDGPQVKENSVSENFHCNTDS